MYEPPMPAHRAKRRSGQFRADPLQSESGPGIGYYTCSGCDLSFSSKKGFDVHRSHKFARPMCKRGFEEAQRLSVAVTSRDFRVSGRHNDSGNRRPRPADVPGMLHDVTCAYMIYTQLHASNFITRSYMQLQSITYRNLLNPKNM